MLHSFLSIPHTTNLKKLVDLIVSKGAKDLENFFGGAGKNALYTCYGATVEFIEAISVWVEEILLE